MSRIAALIPLVLALAACQPAHDGATETARATLASESATLGEEPVARSDQENAQCNADPVQALVGQPISDALIEQALKDSGASFPRVLGVNAAATLDLQAARLNLIIDDNNVIQALHCG